MDPRMPVAMAGAIIAVALWLAGLMGVFYIGYLVICALRKYVGGWEAP
jgi:hypothetical protein